MSYFLQSATMQLGGAVDLLKNTKTSLKRCTDKSCTDEYRGCAEREEA